MMQVHLASHPAPAEWGDNNLVSHSPHGLQIHLPDGSALMTLQQAARRIAGLGIKAVQLMGHWSMPQQWAFAQGYMPTAGAETVTLRWADAPEVELLELEQRLYCATWVRRLTNLSPQELGPLDLALESVTFLSELAPTQISHRILKGEAVRASRLFEEVCLFVECFEGGVSADTVRSNRELIEALQATWDGSASHAKALAAVIRSLAILKPA